MPEANLKFHISAEDKTQHAFDSAKKQAEKMLGVYKEMSKAGMDPSGKFKSLNKLENQFKSIFDKIKRGTKDTSRVTSAKRGGTVAAVGGSLEGQLTGAEAVTTGGADVFAAQKAQTLGRMMKERGQGMSKELSSAEGQAKKTGDELKKGSKAFYTNIKKSTDELKKVATSARGISFGGFGRGGGIRGVNKGGVSQVGGGIASGMLGESLSKMGAATIIPALGLSLGLAGAGYKVMSGMAGAYRRTALPQVGGLSVLGQKKGFQTGYEESGVTGTQKVNLMAAYAKQSMGRTGEEFAGGRSFRRLGQKGTQSQARMMAEVATSYGIAPEQMATQVGTLDRFERQESRKGKVLYTAVGAAERSGMGGARLPEFLGSVEQTLKTAVYEGSYLANDDIIDALERYSRAGDERMKAIAPQTLQKQRGLMMGAARMQGGEKEMMMYHSVQKRLKSLGEDSSWTAVRQQLASGNPAWNAQAMQMYLSPMLPAGKAGAAMGGFMMGNIGAGPSGDPNMEQTAWRNLISQNIPRRVKENDPSALERTAKGRETTLQRKTNLATVRGLTGREVRMEKYALLDVNKSMLSVTEKMEKNIGNILKTLDKAAKSPTDLIPKLSTGEKVAAGIGGVAGTLVLPGIGTIGGAVAGKKIYNALEKKLK